MKSNSKTLFNFFNISWTKKVAKKVTDQIIYYKILYSLSQTTIKFDKNKKLHAF